MIGGGALRPASHLLRGGMAVLTLDDVAEAARLLYGHHWPHPFAKRFGINVRTAERWGQELEAGNGSRSVPPGLAAEIAKALTDHARACAEASRRLAQFSGEP